MMTSKVLREIEAILKANVNITYATMAEKSISLAQETKSVAVYGHQTNSVPDIKRQGALVDSYDFHGFYILVVNVDCVGDKYKVYDIIDDIQKSLLKDTEIWGSLVDRNIVSCEYDNAEFYPKRSAIIGLEVIYRMTCD